jgi:hypothetical protein
VVVEQEAQDDVGVNQINLLGRHRVRFFP